MPDHTEREREARHCTVLAMQWERVERTMKSWDAVFACIDDERAAVRAAVLAEVRAKVERYMEEGCGCGCDADDHADAFNGILAALTALEATDGR